MLLDVTYGRPPSDTGGAAGSAERAGADGVWVGETYSDPFLKALQAAEATRRVTIGTAVAIAFARTPMTVAYAANDLALASDGRFVLGLGTQVRSHVERRFAMPWSDPIPRMREFIAALRAIWAAWHEGAPLAFAGDFYSHSLMTPFFTPDATPAAPIPVYLAAVGDAMAALAGETSDGLIFHPFTTPKYMEAVTLTAVARGAQRAGRDPREVAIAGPVFVCVGRDDQEIAVAREASRSQLAFYASTPSYRAVLELHGWGDLQPELGDLARRGEWKALGDAISDEVLDEFAVTGTPEDVVVDLETRWGALADRVSLYMPYEVPDATRDALLHAHRQRADAPAQQR